MTSTPSEPRLYDVWLMWVEFPDHPREWNKGRRSQPSVCSVLTTGQGQTAMLVIAVIDGLMDLFYEAILIETII